MRKFFSPEICSDLFFLFVFNGILSLSPSLSLLSRLSLSPAPPKNEILVWESVILGRFWKLSPTKIAPLLFAVCPYIFFL